jgi:hypothetical protein
MTHRCALIDDEPKSKRRFVGDETHEETFETSVGVPGDASRVVSDVVRTQIDRLDTCTEAPRTSTTASSSRGSFARDERQPTEPPDDFRRKQRCVIG